MPSIFGSYRRSDAGGHAGRLHDRLRHWYPDDELFFDVNSIEWGDDFPKAIYDAIRTAKIVLVIIGPDWVKEINGRANQPEIDFVRREISIALESRASGKTEIFPILVGNARMPGPSALDMSLTEDLGKLFDCHAHSFPADVRQWDDQFQRLQECIARVQGVPLPEAQLSRQDGRLTFASRESKPTRRKGSVDVSAVKSVFGKVSVDLLNWPQEINGHWIERPELAKLYKLAKGHGSSVTAILGEPGSGKSAILARLGVRLKTEDVVLLAIKADRLPRNTSTFQDLEDWIGSEVPVTEALQKLGKNQRIVVLIDQLDALSDLMDQHTERLWSITRFVNSIRDISNLVVLVSCREFEFHNDIRFKILNADEVTLQRPTWEQVDSLLKVLGLDTGHWSEDVRDVLRTPQHLAMFLECGLHSTGVPLFASYHALLNSIVRRRLEVPHGERTVEVAETIAAEMADEEELWLSRRRFERRFPEELGRLEESGLLKLSGNGLSVGFRHQTVFDFLRASGFLRDGRTLAEYAVEEKGQSLFVRPTLWSTLNYLRDSDYAVYRKQFYALWSRKDLRTHVRDLLVRFLGRIPDPRDQEAQWLLPLLEESTLRRVVLLAVSGSPGWFRRVAGRLAGFMTAGPEQAWEVTPVLRAATAFAAPDVLTLVERNWANDKEYANCAFAVLRNISDWGEDSVDLVCRLVDYGVDDTFLVKNFADKVSRSRPDLAPRIIVQHLRAATRALDEEGVRLDGDIASHELIPGSVKQTVGPREDLRLYQRLLEGGTDWYGIEDIAGRCAKEFVIEIWPWLTQMFTRLAIPENPCLNQYRNHQGLAFLRDGPLHQPLQSAIFVAVTGFAGSDSKGFLEFVQANKASNLNVLHRLLARGLATLADRHPDAVLEYLLEDSRRLEIGDIFKRHADTKALISAVVPRLTEGQALRLEKAIRNWTCYRTIPESRSAESRRERQKRMRRARLNLIRAFPFDRLSAAGKSYVMEEERAFPGYCSEVEPTELRRVVSPMSSEQMDRATNAQILKLFDDLTDDTGWNHPRRRRTDYVGGSIQASREFGEFASKAPGRALSLIQKFQAGRTERPAGAALKELGKSSADPNAMIACVHELDSRGFASQEFREDAASCMSAVAHRAGGLNDNACRLLESWISEWAPEADPDAGAGDSANDILAGNDDDDIDRSLLWSQWGGYVLPHGNYPFLNALMQSCLCRESPAVDKWLDVLERHLTFHENPEVWRAIAHDLWRLAGADPGRATAFFESLYSMHPEAFCSVDGVQMVSKVMSWLPRQFTDKVVDGWSSGDWRRGPQAVGEVFALDCCLNLYDENAHRKAKIVLSGDDHDAEVVESMRVGLTHTFAVAWPESALRAMATKYLVRLAATGSRRVNKALGAVFANADPLPSDDYTGDLLGAFLEQPEIFSADPHFLTKGLKELLRTGWRPKFVVRIVTALIFESAKARQGGGRAWVGDAGDLADIALTLHRIPETREQGLQLCERLMDLHSYDLDERIAKIDNRPFRN